MEFQLIYFVAILFSLALGSVCQGLRTSSIIIKSNSFTEVVDSNYKFIKKAVPCAVYDSWAKDVTDATWIWDTNSPNGAQTVYFRVQFYISGVPISGTLQVACDDYVNISLNGHSTSCDGAGLSYSNSCDVLAYLKSGRNYAVFTAVNRGGPGGLIFKFSLQNKS